MGKRKIITLSVSFYNEDKRLHGNLLLPTIENPPCIVTLHGLESHKDRGKWPRLASQFSEAGFACLRFNFRGCGEGREKSEGDFEDTSLTVRIKDYEASLRFLGKIGKVNMDRLGVVGSSFGGMVAIAAREIKMKALVTLATPYTFSHISLPKDVEGYHRLPSNMKLKELFFEDLQKYDLLRSIKDAPPILIIHGSKDELVSVEHAYELYNNSKKPKKIEIIEGANHTFSRHSDLNKIVTLSQEWFKKFL